MNRPLPDACLQAMNAIQADPLNLDDKSEAHLRHCPLCREARVQWLAMEDAAPPLAPAGYFDTLPDRVQRKLPLKPVKHLHTQPILWAVAAALIVAAGLGGYWSGKATPQPAAVAISVPDTETLDAMPEAPFHDSEDPVNQLNDLTPEESRTVLKKLAASQTSTGSRP